MPKAIGTFRPVGCGSVPTFRPPVDEARRQYERAEQRKADKAFYKSPAWRRVRAIVLAEEPLCRLCLEKDPPELVPSAHVHHVLERKKRPDLALMRSNLQGVCQPCHNTLRGERYGD